MKTPIIQHEPEEPATEGQTVEATAGEPRPSRNLAARMGRWSASHKKTAIFGWLAFVAVAFMLGNAIGTKQLDQNKTGHRRVRTRRLGAARRVQAGSGRPGPDSEHDQDGRRSGLPGGGRRRRPHGRRHEAGEEGRVAVRGRQRGADLQGSPHGARHARASHDRCEAGDDARQARREGDHRRRREASWDRDRGVRRQRRDAARQGGRERLQEGRPVLAAGHADRAGGRLRRADRRRPAAAARTDGGVRDDGTARAAEPADPARQGRQRDRAADRAGGRRRLLALLPQARARGAGRRSERAGCTRGCRCDLGPLGAHLRPDRDGRDGRNAVHRATRRSWASASRRCSWWRSPCSAR